LKAARVRGCFFPTSLWLTLIPDPTDKQITWLLLALEEIFEALVETFQGIPYLFLSVMF